MEKKMVLGNTSTRWFSGKTENYKDGEKIGYKIYSNVSRLSSPYLISSCLATLLIISSGDSTKLSGLVLK